jgi:hypothetical protein
MEVTKMEALQRFFGKVSMEEIKALNPQERTELATMAAEALGLKLKE